ELIRPPGQDGAGASRPAGRRVSLAPWRVPALTFEPAPAVDLLTVLGEPGALSGEVIGASVRYLAAVARLGADLATRGRVLPALCAEDGGHAARWRPVLSGADAERARELAAGPVRTCFRLIEPERGKEGAGLGAAKNSADASGSGGTPDEVPGDWRVEFALQSTDDPSLMMTAADLLAGVSTAGLAAGIK